MFDSNIFYIKVIDNEAELEGMPFVAPEARRGGCFIESFSEEAGTKKIIGQDTKLGKPITGRNASGHGFSPRKQFFKQKR